MRTGGVLGLTYGQETMGVSTTALLAQRRAVAASLVTEGSGDLDLRLALADGTGKAKVDPAFAAHLAPIGAWAEAVWCRWLPHGTLRELMRKTSQFFAEGVRWAVVHGPAAACFASANRLGWTVVSAFEMITDSGETLSLLRDSPAFLRKRVIEAVGRWRAKAIEWRFPALSSDGRGEGPHIGPIVRLLEPRGKTEEWGWEHRGALRSAVAGRQWTQQRLFSAGLVDTKACQLCVATLRCDPCTEDPEFVGTLLHRHCTCPALEPFRREHMPSSLKAKLRECLRADGSMEPADLLWFTRGLRASPFARVPARNCGDTFQWLKEPEEGLLEGDVHADGSLMDSEADLEGRCCALGWSFVVLGPDGGILAAARACPPAWVDCKFGFELWAIQMVCHACVPWGS